MSVEHEQLPPLNEADRVLARDLAAHAGATVVLRGWLHRHRQLKSVSFVVVRDATGLAQAVVSDPRAAAAVALLVPESVLEVRGRAVANPSAPGSHTSSTITSYAPRRARSRHSSPLPAASTSYPSSRSTPLSEERTPGSSSTTRIDGIPDHTKDTNTKDANAWL